MINRDSRGPFAKDVFINQGTKGSGGVSMMTRSAPYEKSKFLGSGGSMVARLKLKEIDGRAPQGVEPAA
ncbi:rRNA intron-encoded homing endonuclease [Aspergillus novofumigatus IBT 16806]|uniref:rRNA intron-encoded homing endonuclease n=1 Tax=Aspergillus novofumigatus (strain IBT 16806) TaxID=1392255 RepID=A0A2I1BS89_ASPN1|nr:rRNA intron-encoded homing endonuclease [Aspergillus novofumigatus IBT 16806]PKX88291.1 rRNA intron-encoded homing endonuclease [Aspergillus novofumigatus IBT 16806]